MRLHRFYLYESIGDKKNLVVNSAELINQLKNVFRLKGDDKIIIFDGSGHDYIATIESFNRDIVELKIISSEDSRFVPVRNVILCMSLIKKDKFELVVEKATELGISRIIPILAERSEKKSLDIARLKRIAIEASEQCGRGNIPVIKSIMTLKDTIKLLGNSGLRITMEVAPRCDLHGDSPLEVIPTYDKYHEISIFIGPEGGWSENELALFHQHNIPLTSLGKSVLRAETAAIVAVAKMLE